MRELSASDLKFQNGSALQVSLGYILQDLFLKRQVSHHLLQPAILALKLLQAFDLVGRNIPLREGAIQNRELFAQKMTVEQIAKAQKLARDWIAAH